MKRLLLVSLAALGFTLNGSVLAAPTAEAEKKGVITSVDKEGKAHSTKGYVAMKAAPGSKKFAASPKIASAKLPRKVDLRPKMTKIEDQGETSSCVANAVAGSFEYWVKEATKKDYDVSRLFVYFNARWRNGDQDKDEGSVIQLAMEGLKEFGACSEEKWPFKKPLLLKKPNGEAYKEADQAKIKEMAQVPLELTAWKQALASGYPIVFGCLLFESFDECNKRGGVVPMPNPNDLSRESHGGHSMCVVGYSDKEQVFIVRNSWGDKWGDKGYCYMPYDYLMNPQFNGGDSWVFVPETPIENPEDTWIDDDKPVTDDGRGVTFVINPYTIDDYKKVKITWWEDVFVEYEETAPEEYVQYVEYAEADQYDEMESFEIEEVVEEWQEENPDDNPDLYVYDGVEDEVDESDADAEEEVMDEEADDDDAEEAEEDAEEYSDEDMEEEVTDEDAEEESGEEEADEEEYEEDSEGADESGEEDVEEEEVAEDEGDYSEEDAEEEMEEEAAEDDEEYADDSGEEEMEEEEYEEEGGEEEDAGEEEEAYEDDGGGDEGGGEEE